MKTTLVLFLYFLFCNGKLVINEVSQSFTDKASFVEIYNTDATHVVLANYSLSLLSSNQGGVTPYNVPIPNGALILGHGHYVVCSAGPISRCQYRVDRADFQGLKAVALKKVGATVDSLSFNDVMQGYTEGEPISFSSATNLYVSWSRIPDGTDTDNNKADFALSCATPDITNTNAALSTCGTAITTSFVPSNPISTSPPNSVSYSPSGPITSSPRTSTRGPQPSVSTIPPRPSTTISPSIPVQTSGIRPSATHQTTQWTSGYITSTSGPNPPTPEPSVLWIVIITLLAVDAVFLNIAIIVILCKARRQKNAEKNLERNYTPMYVIGGHEMVYGPGQ